MTGGNTSTTFTIATLDDALADNAETIIVDIDSIVDTNNSFEAMVEGTNNQVTTVITDDVDVVSIDLAGPTSLIEGGAAGTYTVKMTDADNNAVSAITDVTVALSYTGSALDGTDFSGVTSVTVAAGSSTGTFDINALTDGLAEGIENFTVTLGAITGGTELESLTVDSANDEVTTSIVDLDSAVLAVDDVTVDEASGTATFTVMLSQAVPGGFTVNYTLSDGTATGGGVDYTSTGGLITFAGTSGETQTIVVPISDDFIADSGETFTVSLSASTALVDDSDTATGTINDEAVADSALVSIVGPGNVVEGEATTSYTVSVSETPTSNITVNFTYSGVAGDGTDFNGVGGVIISAGSTSTTFSINTLDDAFADDAESFTVTITGVTGGSFEAIGIDTSNDDVTTIINDEIGSDGTPGPEDTAEVSLVGPGSVAEGATTSAYTVSIDEVPLSDVVVNLNYSGVAADGTDFTGVASATIATGSTSATFTIDTLDDALVEGAENFVVTIGTITGGGYEEVVANTSSNTVTTTITDQIGVDGTPGPEDQVEVSLVGPTSVTEGDTTTAYTVTLEQAVPAGNSVTVNLAYTGTAADGSDFTGVASVVVTGGNTSTTFTIATLDEALADNAETIIVDIDSIVGYQ